MFLFFLTFEAGHVLKVVLKFWPNLRLNVLIKFVLKKKKSVFENCLEIKEEKERKPTFSFYYFPQRDKTTRPSTFF